MLSENQRTESPSMIILIFRMMLSQLLQVVFQKISVVAGRHLSHYMSELIMEAESGNGHHYILFLFEISLLVIVALPNF